MVTSNGIQSPSCLETKTELNEQEWTPIELQDDEQEACDENADPALTSEPQHQWYEERAEEISREERYNRLMVLLQKSAFYSKYMADKLSQTSVQSNVEPVATKAQKAKKRKRANAADARQLLDQPKLLSGGELRDYQVEGYKWMVSLYENGINGILADEMGLGKTIQCIALFSHLIEQGVPGPFLIVAPLSTLSNWVDEFSRFTPSIPVLLYHGNKTERAEMRNTYLTASEDVEIENGKRAVRYVFITSYEIIIRDQSALGSTPWRFIVVDEGHRLKNQHCRLSRELRKYGAVNRLLLTGTPLQNDLTELWSLLNFLMEEIFDDLRVFQSWFDIRQLAANERAEVGESQVESADERQRIVDQERQDKILATLHQILSPFMLRRVKADVALQLPPKREVVVKCAMTEVQLQMYKAVLERNFGQKYDNGRNDRAAPIRTEEGCGGRRRRGRKVDYTVFDSIKLDAIDAATKAEYDQLGKTKESNDDDDQCVQTLQTAELNFSTKNILMDLRKVANHPYLVEYPLEEDGKHYRIDDNIVASSGKMQVFDQLLHALLAQSKSRKILVFSQMTRMLDIVADYLALKSDDSECDYVRLDGRTQLAERQANVRAFQNPDSTCRIFLLSTRAGGLGINLTAADTCIIFDSDWNPQQDLQAQDRCHRIGQTQPTMIYRLVSRNSVDQIIVERASAKRKLEKLIIGKGKFNSADCSIDELIHLLKSSNADDEVQVGEQSSRGADCRLDSAELDRILDRSPLLQPKLANDSTRLKSNKARRIH